MRPIVYNTQHKRETKTMTQFTIPFNGFYSSIHMDNIQRDIKQAFNRRDLCPEIPYTAYHPYDDGDLDGDGDGIDLINFKQLFTAYSNDYASEFAQEFLPTGFNLKFCNVQSPKEYNFTTDIIICEAPISALISLFNTIMSNKDYVCEFKKTLKALFTDRSGFYSFYSNNLDDWLAKNPHDYDANEWGAVIETWVNTQVDESQFNDWQLYCMDGYFENGGYVEHYLTDAGQALNAACSQVYYYYEGMTYHGTTSEGMHLLTWRYGQDDGEKYRCDAETQEEAEQWFMQRLIELNKI